MLFIANIWGFQMLGALWHIFLEPVYQECNIAKV